MDIEEERKRFEAWISGPPVERSTQRFPDDEVARSLYQWPGQYVQLSVQIAWEAWQEALHQGVVMAEYTEKECMQETIRVQDAEIDQLRAENERLMQALEKIADWRGVWGPYPEGDADWRAMAIVTAREAVGGSCDEGE